MRGKHLARAGIPLALSLLLIAGGAGAEIYRYVDSKGRVHLSDRRLNRHYYPVTPKVKRRAASLVNRSGRARFRAAVGEVARRYDMNEALLHAVIANESAYDPAAESSAGAMGLMQLMPGTASRYGVENPWDPRQNLDGGARYLNDLLKRFRDLELALAAYNAGEGAVVRYGYAIPPYPETRTYVGRVLRTFRAEIAKAGRQRGCSSPYHGC